LMRLLTEEHVRAAEEAAVNAGASEDELMVRAGEDVASRILAAHPPGSFIIILAGPGKNGGDGLVAAAHLAENDVRVAIWAFGRKDVGDVPIDAAAAANLEWLESVEQLRDCLEEADAVVDAVFGIGSRGSLPDEVVEAFDCVRSAREDRHLDIWALDVPSGMDSTTGDIARESLQADVTLMIGLPKTGAYQFPAARYTGYVSLVDIGLEPPADLDHATPMLINAKAGRRRMPVRRAGIHKRSAGTVMVVGGAPNYFGAPRLSAEAALRSGAGMVTVAAPGSIIGSIATAVPELVFLPLPVAEHASASSRMAKLVRERLDQTDALVVGPGLGTDAPVPEFLSQLFGITNSVRGAIGFGAASEPEEVEPFAGKAVIDADGLNWLSKAEDWWIHLDSAKLVLTPHPGELGRLLGKERSDVESEPWDTAREAAAQFGQTVVLKHGHSVVAAPDGRLWVAEQAPPALATAGTGDVLSGVIGAFLAQGCDPEDAAVAGVALGLRATALAEEASGSIGIVAGDIIRALPRARDEIMHVRTDFE
jgi:ADP-dependent NAD(P)H-hydrate dehydratase / NAD(P)H-hydrate epimerase